MGGRADLGKRQWPGWRSHPHEMAFLSTSIHESEKASRKRLACLVDQTLRISNLRFLEGALEIQRFIDYCEKGD